MLEESERIKSKSDLREWLLCERTLYFSDGRRRTLRALFGMSEKAIIFKYQMNLRRYEYHLNTGHKVRSVYYHAKANRLGFKYGLHIGPNVCGKGLMIMHLGSVLINGDARIGRNCKIHINVAIVGGGTDKGAPYLGDGVTIGVGATLLGGIRIADGVGVGAGAVVNKSFDEPGIAIAGVPARKISNNGSAKW